ncbi:hypothetical protein THASP1DRAFT_26827 [Thamnocephalis sphaerospora]|uniref:SH3 domain-containing protein n=1 Tax=Thamnocephalis sphaerospora TaxID=78915 RepID=A0A4P9XG39_9FUNG|nr:hypothetical protein THASP1DRAFT_26827 [Thamnocephalis sphaerospora]|eukprot:RKP04574.1 hypothetical protein THASP1DRAFT_26827 [Thamnocephalis sphaerospora]
MPLQLEAQSLLPPPPMVVVGCRLRLVWHLPKLSLRHHIRTAPHSYRPIWPQISQHHRQEAHPSRRPEPKKVFWAKGSRAVKAIYDYDATMDEEISFREGDIIRCIQMFRINLAVIGEITVECKCANIEKVARVVCKKGAVGVERRKVHLQHDIGHLCTVNSDE